MPPTQDVNMQMRDSFASIWPVIDDQTVTGLGQSGFFRHLARLEQQVSKNLTMFGIGFGDSRKNLLRKNQKMHRRLRLDVFDGQDQVIFVHNLCRNLPGNDLLEQSFAHAGV